MSENIKTFVCKNPNSKFKGILNDDSILGNQSVNFVFESTSDNCYWPLNSNMLELIEDGWEILSE